MSFTDITHSFKGIRYKDDDRFFNRFSSFIWASTFMSSCNLDIVLSLKEKMVSFSPLAAAKITCSITQRYRKVSWLNPFLFY